MGIEPYRKKRIGGLVWRYREGADDLLALDFLGGEVLSDADENRVRIRGFYRAGEKTYFVKVFKGGGIGRSLKSLLLGHPALREFYSSHYIAAHGVPTPEAVAVGTTVPFADRAVIVFRAIDGASPVRDLFLSAGAGDRARYLSSIAAVTAALHRASFHHRDYHAGNLLVPADGGANKPLWVVDLHRSSFPRDMSKRRGIMNVAAVLHSLLPALTEADIGIFLSRYREENPASRWDPSDAARIVADRIGKVEERRLKSRTRRCLMNSTEFFVARRPKETVYGARGMSVEEAVDCIGRLARGRATILKRDRKATVALVKTDRGEVCIKAYERLSLSERIKALFGRSRGQVSWVSARGLSLRGFHTPRHLFLVIRRGLLFPRAVYLITEPIHPAVEMDRFIEKSLASDRRSIARFAAAVGTLVGSLHRAGVYHRDLKATNIAVKRRGGTFTFSFLDLDAVSFYRALPARRMTKNLAQLFLSTPTIIDAGARRAFFSAYLEAAGATDEKKAIARRVEKMVRGQEILYVGARGDVTEDAREICDRLFREEGR